MKKLLMLSAALVVAGSVAAANVTHPFYGPEAGKFLSDSSFTYNNIDTGAAEAAVLNETLTYGITNDASVSVKVADTYYFDMGARGHEKYDNPGWGVSAKYNIVNDAWKVQAEAGYDQGMGGIFGANIPTSFTYTGVEHLKDIYGTVKVGYEAGDGFVPYASLTATKIIGDYNQDPSYTARVAAYKDLGNKFSVDGGLSYQWDSSKEMTDGWKHFKAWVADAGVNYALADNMSVGVKGSYLIKTNLDPWFIDDAYTLGANFKVAF